MLLRSALLLVIAAAVPACAKNYTVMVFGDSWGSLGPSWHEIQDVFDRNNVTAVVKSAARYARHVAPSFNRTFAQYATTTAHRVHRSPRRRSAL